MPKFLFLAFAARKRNIFSKHGYPPQLRTFDALHIHFPVLCNWGGGGGGTIMVSNLVRKYMKAKSVYDERASMQISS